jgi:hypothetical protein
MNLKDILLKEIENIVPKTNLEFPHPRDLETVQLLIFKLHELESQLRIDIAGKRHENIQRHE